MRGTTQVIWLAFSISLILLTATVLIHYELLLGISEITIEIVLYAGVFFLMERYLDLGTLEGQLEGGALDFSITTYTTLGVGDVAPTGLIRVIAGVESLNGLVLIGWSASFTYLSMEKLWEHDSVGRRDMRLNA
jgi:Ion channel